MCYERWMRRRDEEARESRELWRDFERTQPVADRDVRDEDPEPMQAREEVPVEDR
jgi:hypothetical protein